nr:MAG TPA: hypothetical protein [Caudoviricetes sp.]
MEGFFISEIEFNKYGNNLTTISAYREYNFIPEGMKFKRTKCR